MITSILSRRSLHQPLAICILALASVAPVHSQEKTEPAKPAAPAAVPNPEADEAWANVAKENARPVPPGGWSKDKPPSQAEFQMWRKAETERLMKVAELAGDFLKRFPQHEKAELAMRKRGQALEAAGRMGDPEANKLLAAMETERLKSADLPEEERLQLRVRQVQRDAQTRASREAALETFELGLREVAKEFPKRPEPYGMLVQIAEQLPEEKKRALLQEIANGDAPEEAKKQAAAALKLGDAIGKPVDIKFTAIDGREIDLNAMKGKVVLIDFWATWCGPCIAEMPNVKAAYEKLNSKGFEIVGISFDQDKGALEKFVKEEKIPWPQFFDGKGWKNQYGQEFGIRSIPAMWLVDKKGNLRDMNARADLVEKVEKLLEE